MEDRIWGRGVQHPTIQQSNKGSVLKRRLFFRTKPEAARPDLRVAEVSCIGLMHYGNSGPLSVRVTITGALRDTRKQYRTAARIVCALCTIMLLPVPVLSVSLPLQLFSISIGKTEKLYTYPTSSGFAVMP